MSRIVYTCLLLSGAVVAQQENSGLLQIHKLQVQVQEDCSKGGCKPSVTNQTVVCCEAISPECESCKSGKSPHEFCASNPKMNGCDIYLKVCCHAMTASCESCKSGKSPQEYCETNPKMNGCNLILKPSCPGQQVWSKHCPSCTSSCRSGLKMTMCEGRTSDFVCNGGCVCPSDKPIHGENGTCVAEAECTIQIPQTCPGNQVWSDQCPGCSSSCFQGGKQTMCFGRTGDFVCNGQCVCPSDKPIHGKNGMCVAECEIPKPEVCPGNQVWSKQCPGCTSDCFQGFEQMMCEMRTGDFVCNGQCVCPSDTPIRGQNGTCVATCEKPIVIPRPKPCRGDMIWNDCASCESFCASGEELTICASHCEAKCDCPAGSVVLDREMGTCVQKGDCPEPEQPCLGDQVWQSEVSCFHSCDEFSGTGEVIALCLHHSPWGRLPSACACPSDRPNALADGSCVAKCPAPITTTTTTLGGPDPGCTGGKEWKGCPSCWSDCDTVTGDVHMVCAMGCNPGCACPSDKPVELDGTCVTAKECSRPPQECKGDLVWDDCRTCQSSCNSGRVQTQCAMGCLSNCGCPSDKPVLLDAEKGICGKEQGGWCTKPVEEKECIGDLVWDDLSDCTIECHHMGDTFHELGQCQMPPQAKCACPSDKPILMNITDGTCVEKCGSHDPPHESTLSMSN